jgi:hypothetical protein
MGYITIICLPHHWRKTPCEAYVPHARTISKRDTLRTVIAWVWAVSVVLESHNSEWDDFYLMRSNNLRINPIGSLET